MKIAVVSHEASLTGAPIVTFDFAAHLAKSHNVLLISKDDGPLCGFEHYREAIQNILVTGTHHRENRADFETNARNAIPILESFDPDIVYVSTAAAGEWIAAAVWAGFPCVHHIHEMRGGIANCINADLFRPGLTVLADLVVAASGTIVQDLHELCPRPLRPIYEFGIAINVERILGLRSAAVTPAADAAGNAYVSGERPLVAMSGTADLRKGADIFFAVAKALPQFDFLWIGDWEFPDMPLQNPVLAAFREDRLANLFVSGQIENPFAYLDMADVFLLTSREDPNPLVVAEALALGKRCVCFTETGGSHVILKEHGYVLSGAVSADRIIGFLPGLLAERDPPGWLAAKTAAFQAQIDTRNRFPLLEEKLCEIAGFPVPGA